MRKLILAISLSALVLCVWAQTPKEEALKSLDSAKSLISQDNLSKAMDEINYAITKINEIQAEKLVKMLPPSPAGYTEEERQSSGLGNMGAMMGSANAITATVTYNKGPEDMESRPTMTVTISVGGFIGQMGNLAAMGQMYGGSQPGSRSVRVQGYTGNLQWDNEEKTGTLTLQVGQKSSVVIEGSYLTSGDELTSLAEKMNLTELEKSF